MFVATGGESESSTSNASYSVQQPQLCRRFEFHEILLATSNFDESLVIGEGGFGKVYKGDLKNGSTLMVAAIKRLDVMSAQGASEFWAEVEMLSKLRHCNLVSLIGYCDYDKEMILVYEYISNGTLEDHLHKLGTPLSWCQRLEICIDAARGLDYLHSGTGIKFGIIHRDVKSSNILLDATWAAKVPDFGLSKISPKNQSSTHVSTLVKGTFGYFDPNYFATGKLTMKSDVYAFGVVLLEVLCRRRAVDDSLDWGLTTWAQDSIKEGRLKDIVDSDIKDEISSKCLKQFAQLIERCLDNHPKYRPTMAEVFVTLEIVLNLQKKIDILLQNGGKTVFDRMAYMFSFTNNTENSGKEFRSLMPKKSHIASDFKSIIPKKLHMNLGSLFANKKKAMLRKKFYVKNGALLLKNKLENAVSSIKIFGVDDLEKATRNFATNMIIGRGGYGVVYKGMLPDGRLVAIKKGKLSDQVPLVEFINEIVILGQINHRNVVQLLGCCLETEVPLLAYEFVPNGTLYEHIHYNTSPRGRLSWDTRLRIALESAEALHYLHSGADISIIHRDVKSSNILLDENYSPKMSDFGASKLIHEEYTLNFGTSKSIHFSDEHAVTEVRGTLGYLDPEYFQTNRLSRSSDVYSFGVVLAELMTGLKPIDPERCKEDRNLAAYFMRSFRKNQVHKIVDHHVLEEASSMQLKAACDLACRCLDIQAGNRPHMKQVTDELQRIRDYTETFKKT